MLLKFLINTVRWCWDLPPFDFAANLAKNDLAHLIEIGAVIDAIALCGIAYLAITIFDKCKRR